MGKTEQRMIPKTSYLEGLRLCKQNVERLSSKSLELHKQRQFLASFLIGFAAWEEVGKALFILKYWDKEYISQKQWKKEFKVHREKLIMSQHQRDIAFLKLHADKEYIESIVSGKTVIMDDIEDIQKHIDMRTACLYVDYNNGLNKFIPPVIDEKTLAEYSINTIFKCADCYAAMTQEASNKKIVFS
jgi:AbiV family abortive infection protein